MKGLRKLAAFWVLSGTCMASTSPPLKVYVTYLGGSFADTVSGMAVDSSGSQYVAGTSFSPDFPLSNLYRARSAFGDTQLRFCHQIQSDRNRNRDLHLCR